MSGADQAVIQWMTARSNAESRKATAFQRLSLVQRKSDLGRACLGWVR
jgi:hypothetical protein